MKRKHLASIALLLLVAMLGAACGPGGAAAETTAPVTTAAPTTTSPDGVTTEAVTTYDPTVYDENGYLLDSLGSYNFEGDTMNILSWKCYYTEWVEEDNGEVVNSALFARDRAVEERLNVDIEVEQIDGSNQYRTQFLQKVTTLIDSGDQETDLIAQYSWVSGNATLRGYYQDIAQYDVLDFGKPWWPSDMVESSRVGDSIFFVTGDIAPSLIYGTFVTLFNTELIQSNQLENPYDLVRSGEWTLDKLFEMSENFYADLDGSQTVTAGDQFGFVFVEDTCTKPFLYSTGLRVIDVNQEGEYQLSPHYSGEKMIDLIDRLNSWIFMVPGIVFNERDYTETSLFIGGNTLFSEVEANYMINVLPEVDVPFGVVPAPKYNTDQQEYYSFCANGVTTYSIPMTVLDGERSAVLIEALASESYRRVTPALFEVALKIKHSPNPEASEMLDLIHDSMVVDIAPYYTDNLLGYKEMRTILNADMIGWSSQYAGIKNMLAKSITNINKKLSDISY